MNFPRRPCTPVLLLAAVAVLGTGCRAESAGGTLTLGLAAPLTRTFGENSRMGAELAAAEINARGGAGGRTLVIQPRDDEADPAAAIRVAQAFAEDPEVRAVVGHATSGELLSAASVYNAAEIVAVGTSTTSTDIATAGPWVFRVASADSANAAAVAREALRSGRRVGILYANDEYGRSLRGAFLPALEEGGAQVVGDHPYLEEMPDFRPYLLRLKSRGAQVVLVAGLEVGAATLIRQMREVGLDARVLGGDGLESLTTQEGNYDGTMIGMLYHPEASDRAREFARAFRGRFGREPDSSAATAYDAVYLLARAADAGATSRGEIRRYLDGVGRPGGSEPFQGVTGPVAFDEHGDPRGKPVVIAAIQGSGFRLVRTSE